LAYDQDPRSGRAYIPGQNPKAKDKFADYPTGEGPGNRRSAEIRAGLGRTDGAHTSSQLPLAVAFGAGRLVWTDGEDLFSWAGYGAAVERKTLSSYTLMPGKDSLLAFGWLTYLRTEQGFVQHDGLTGSLQLLTQERFESVATWNGKIALIQGGTLMLFETMFKSQGGRLPFALAALASSDGVLAAYGQAGQVAVWQNRNWLQLLEGEPLSSFAQGWIVNGHPGVRTVNGQLSRVRYANPEQPDSASLSFPVISDAPVSAIPGRGGFEQHRLLGFVGGSDPHIEIYRPGETGPMSEKRAFGISALGSTASAVRRSSTESGIVIAAADIFESKVQFGFLRDSTQPLPGAMILPPGTTHSWLVPHLEGLMVLSFDGRRSIVNKIPFSE
jgi:hypothetical protein